MSQNENLEDDELTEYISRSGWYRLHHPRAWVVQDDEECISLYNPEDGVGALQISAYVTGEPQNPKEVLVEHLEDNQVSFTEKNLLLYEVNTKRIASYDYIENQWYKKLWFIAQGSHLILITYTCEVEDQERERNTTEAIISSIIIKGN